MTGHYHKLCTSTMILICTYVYDTYDPTLTIENFPGTVKSMIVDPLLSSSTLQGPPSSITSTSDHNSLNSYRLAVCIDKHTIRTYIHHTNMYLLIHNGTYIYFSNAPIRDFADIPITDY